MRGWLAAFGLLGCAIAGYSQELPAMKFNEVREIAPGVFFRYSAISPTDKSIFGGSNNIWVIFKDHVLVYDANFPKEAGDVIGAVRKTTDKPIRYVVDSHHHGDHAYGNAVFARAGAKIIASIGCARLLQAEGPAGFEREKNNPKGRKDIAESELKLVDMPFIEQMVLEDEAQRAELIFLGHAHTAGDAVMYLPRHKILCTGDACTNGPYNFMGHSDSASWVRVLERMKRLDVKVVCPGHGPLAGKEVIDWQQRYFVELREHVARGIEAGKDIEDIIKSVEMPWHKEWTGIEARDRVDNIRHVYDELTGRVRPYGLIEDYSKFEGPAPPKEGWTKPTRIVVPWLMPARLLELKRLAPDVQFITVRDAEDAAKEAPGADAVLGFASADIVKAGGKKLRWVQAGQLGSDKIAPPTGTNIVVTDLRPLGGVGQYERQWRLFRENLRRFVAGEGLLGVVQKQD